MEIVKSCWIPIINSQQVMKTDVKISQYEIIILHFFALELLHSFTVIFSFCDTFSQH